MQTILDSAHTWFLESCALDPSGGLVIRLVEGIKGSERQLVDVGAGGAPIGPYFPVTIERQSRCVVIYFAEVRGFFSYDESYDTGSLELVAGEGRFLRQVEDSSFRKFVGSATSVTESYRGDFVEYLVCCEDQIFQVLASGHPEVSLVDCAPDFSIERGGTWLAS